MIDSAEISCRNCKINLELDPIDISAGLFDYIARTVCCVHWSIRSAEKTYSRLT